MKIISKDDISYFLKAIFKKKTTCPYCSSTPVVYAKKYLVVDICKCNTCGLFYVNPMYLSNHNTKGYYNNSYTSDATILPKVEDIEIMKRNNFKGNYKDYNNRLSVIRKLVDGNKLMEFGSSWGYFLFQSNAYDFNSVGVEISAKRAEYGHNYLGVKIFSDLESVHDIFDIIYSSHVLEHLLDIHDIFTKFYERLSPGGSLIIEVPNFAPENNGKAAYSAIGKVHPLGFCKKFFEVNLPTHGFSVLNIVDNYSDLLRKEVVRSSLDDVIIVHAKKERTDILCK